MCLHSNAQGPFLIGQSFNFRTNSQGRLWIQLDLSFFNPWVQTLSWLLDYLASHSVRTRGLLVQTQSLVLWWGFEPLTWDSTLRTPFWNSQNSLSSQPIPHALMFGMLSFDRATWCPSPCLLWSPLFRNCMYHLLLKDIPARHNIKC